MNNLQDLRQERKNIEEEVSEGEKRHNRIMKKFQQISNLIDRKLNQKQISQ